jgi:putative endonuclease
MSSHRQQLGSWAEQQACHLLQQQGYICIRQQFHSRYGEIDLIMADEQQLLFVEVKARGGRSLTPAHQTVTPSKQLKMAKTALYFLQTHPEYSQHYARFDVVSFDFIDKFSKTALLNFSTYQYHMQWIENAFTFHEELINL